MPDTVVTGFRHLYKWKIGSMTDFVLALTTLPGDADAAAFGRSLVERGVAACVTVLPAVRSIYAWQGAIEDSREQQLLIKTAENRVADLWKAVRASHPYDVPEFIVVPISFGNPAYLEWIRSVVSDPARG
jgi:periplasmic divalent cation tolerance protein